MSGEFAEPSTVDRRRLFNLKPGGKLILVFLFLLPLIVSEEDVTLELRGAKGSTPTSAPNPAVVRLEIIAVLPDASNSSLSLSRALGRSLNAGTAHLEFESNVFFPGRNITWKVKNYVGREEGPNGVFLPGQVAALCDFLERSRPLAIVNFIPHVPSERIVSLVSSAAVVPLLGSTNLIPSPTHEENELYINLSPSVRHVALALGHLLIHCHWHSFAVLFDDSPAVLSSQSTWEETLGGLRATANTLNFSLYNNIEDFVDYDETGGRSPEDSEDDDPALRPNFITLRTRSPNSAFRALSDLMKATQGVIVLLCSQRTMFQVFRAAQQLRMLNGEYVFLLVGQPAQFEVIPDWIPNGVLAIRSPRISRLEKTSMKTTGKVLSSAFSAIKDLLIYEEDEGGSRPIKNSNIHDLRNQLFPTANTYLEEQKGKQTKKKSGFLRPILDALEFLPNVSCWKDGFHPSRQFVSSAFAKEIRSQMGLLSEKDFASNSGQPLTFDILNLMRRMGTTREWDIVGNVSVETGTVSLKTIRWPGGQIFGPGERPTKAYRVVTIVSPPFLMVAEAEDNKTCVKGTPCLKVATNNKDELALIFTDFEAGNGGGGYSLQCCHGLATDLLTSIGRELKFDYDLYLVPDGFYGSKASASGQWNGLMGAIVSGGAHMSFAPFSVTSMRSLAVDFSTPFFFSGVGFLGKTRDHDVPLFAFLAPFSPELWLVIFITLNITALAVALYEWFSPFGLNPWGRQRTKNFSMASALWVVWGRLFSHLVAFKAPKSWPNKFLINVWGGFSVIFVASYTANIAALFAGMFFERAVDVHDRSLLHQRVASVKHSATDFYIKRENPHLWEHIQEYPVFSFDDGIAKLKNGTLDLLVGDGPLLDYYRGTDSKCELIDVSGHHKIGDDTYAVAMTRGFPLKESISALVAKYIQNGYMDYLQGKWYGQMNCFRPSSRQFGARPLGVEAVTGMIIMLTVGIFVGVLILFLELIVYKYALPYFRAQPKGTLWRSPNLMFFSQKLYRFINCVELVSPHHAAKELMHTLKQGQITSLFQKSVKREHELKRRRKSKAQFFEMIQEIRRVQQAEKAEASLQVSSSDVDSPAIFSIHGRLEATRATPKVTRVLGEGAHEFTTQHSLPHHHSHHMELHQRRGLSSVSAEELLPPPSEFLDDGTSSGGFKTRKRLRRSLGEGSERPLRPLALGAEDEDVTEGMNKEELLAFWRDSENELRRQLSHALKTNEEMAERLYALERSRAASQEPP